MTEPLEPPTAPDGGARDLEELLVQALDVLESEGPAGLERLLALHPDHAPAVRENLERIHRMGLSGPPPDRHDFPERLGDFRILAPLGEGGMGVVFRAMQESLGREVALKLIRPDQLFFAGAHERFQREVELVARMQHPGIVPVLAVGRQDGLPYFAMELVHGVALSDVISAFAGRDPRSLVGRDLERVLLQQTGAAESGEPEAFFRGPWTTVVLRMLQRVAEALEHAHGRGVLHRDVKPSNIMITVDGRVLLLDFGLAGGGGGERLTRTGSQLGSLAYMAPELLAGEPREFDARCDVYSLGATAWELLTLRLPHLCSDPVGLRQEAQVAARPKLGSLNSAVSLDVETVVATALEPDAARRYDSAAAFARDVGNVLQHRPIDARRASPWLRLARWTRRRPAAATAVAMGALMLLVGPLGWQLNRLRTLRDTQAAFARSEQDFRTALKAIGHVLRDTASEDLEDVPRAQRARLTAIERALELYADLQRGRENSTEVLFEGGELHKARGDVLRDLGLASEARSEFELSVALHRRALLLRSGERDASFLAAALGSSGKVEAALGHPAAALPFYAEALELARAAEVTGAVEDSEPATRSRRRLKIAKHLLDTVEAHRLLYEVGVDELLAEALEIASAVRAELPASAEAAWIVGRSEDESAWIERWRGRPEEGLVHARLALAGYADAHALESDARFFEFDVATGHGSVANCLLALGRHEEAEREAQAGLAIVSPLLGNFPDSTRYRNFELELQGTLAMTFGRRGMHERARPLFERCARERERLAELEPESCVRARQAAEALCNFAIAQILGHTEIEAALLDLERAERRLAVCTGHVDPGGMIAALSDRAAYNRALALCFLDRPSAALPLIEARTASTKEEAFALRMSADLWNEYWLALRRSGSEGHSSADLEHAHERILEELWRAVDAGYCDLDELRGNPALDPLRADPGFQELLEAAGDRSGR